MEEEGREIAAVDLGSNSFHMLVARAVGDELQVVDRLRESVRLAAGLDKDRRLSVDAQQRALACLEKFGQRLGSLPVGQARVVGTNTMRRMRKSAWFIAQAEAALGHPIEIISGVEEARLIYGGVMHGVGAERPRRLVIDIGGGSTELVIGEGAEPRLLESVALGCVVHTSRYFSEGRVSRKAFKKARLAAAVEIEYLQRAYRKRGWDVALGASGSIRSVLNVQAGNGWGEHAITREGLEKVVELVLDCGQIEKMKFKGLREDRQPIFAGSLVVLAGIFDSLGIEQMEVSDRALREGLLYDLLGRLSDRDIRGKSVDAMARRFNVDLDQAERVGSTALHCLDEVVDDWGLDRNVTRRYLAWAGRLHEIGLALSHSSYHKHGQYMLKVSDIDGFSQTDQEVLAALVRSHRGKVDPHVFDDLSPAWVEPAKRMTILLRLAYVLHRSRETDVQPRPKIELGKNSMSLSFEPGWLEGRPLTAGDLEAEADRLKAFDVKLKVQ